MDGPMSGLRCAMQFEDCIREDLRRRGRRQISEGRTSWLGSRGMVDIADTLSAIKKLVLMKRRSPWIRS